LLKYEGKELAMLLQSVAEKIEYALLMTEGAKDSDLIP
jgi:hypothetical protein